MIGAQAVQRLIAAMAENLKIRLEERGVDNPAMVGIHTGGVWVAERLHRQLGIADPLGSLDISFYRDDFTRIGMNPDVRPSNLPFEIEGRHIVLVDDVLYTGRTIRAALNEIFDYGRPASVTLAVLVNRTGRELPVEAEVSGMQLDLNPREHIKLIDKEEPILVIQQAP